MIFLSIGSSGSDLNLQFLRDLKGLMAFELPPSPHKPPLVQDYSEATV